MPDLPNQLPSTVVDSFLYFIADRVIRFATYRDEEPDRDAPPSDNPIEGEMNATFLAGWAPLEELIATAINSPHQVFSVAEDPDPVIFRDPAWRIPEERVEQFANLCRYLASEDDGYPFPDVEISATHWIGLSEAWVLRQGLFQEGDSSAVS